MDNKPTKALADLEGETLETDSGGDIRATEPAKAPPPAVNQDNPSAKSGHDPLEDATLYKIPLINRLSRFRNLYLGVFVILLILAGAVVYAALKWGNEAAKTAKSPTLTSDQLSALAGTTTIVGDSKQTLDVQSAAIFEGQVLMRGDLNVAGALKVGGSLSLPTISVGSGTFTTLQVNETLSVSGNSTLSGQLSVGNNLTVAGSASFGSVSASQLSVSSLQLTGDLSVNRHITPGGGTPGKSNGSALGSGGTVSVSGSDTAGTVTINTGGGPPAGCFVTVTFAQKFNVVPHIVISPSNSSGAGLNYYTNRTNTTFSLCSANTPSPSTTYIFDYIALD